MSARAPTLPNQQLSFPRKLWDMINAEPDELICWSPDGDSFVIRDQPTFCAEVLPRHFRHNNLTSLQRQLNLYGFSRRSRATEAGAYLHPLFKRDQPRNLDKIKRKPKGKNADFDSSPPPVVPPEPEMLVKKIEQAEAAKIEAALLKKKKKRSLYKAKPQPPKAKKEHNAPPLPPPPLMSTSPTTACAFPDTLTAADAGDRECDVGAVAFEALNIATDEEDGGEHDEELLGYDPQLDPDEELIDPELVWSPDGGMPARPGFVDYDPSAAAPEPGHATLFTGRWPWHSQPADPDTGMAPPDGAVQHAAAHPAAVALPPDSEPKSARHQLKRQLSRSAPEGRSQRSLAQLLHNRQQHFDGVAGDDPLLLSPRSPSAKLPDLRRSGSGESDLGLLGADVVWRRVEPACGNLAETNQTPPHRAGKGGGDVSWDPQDAMLDRRAGRAASQVSTSSLDWDLDPPFDSFDVSRAFDSERTLFQLEH